MSGPTALIDAAIVYGAERILSGRHDDPAWAYRDAFRRPDDERLFRELLHQLVLYDTLYLDQSSISESVSSEVLALAGRINGGIDVRSGEGTIRVFWGGGMLRVSHDDVKSSFCQYLGALLQRSEELRATLLDLPIPWAYRQEGHHDRGSVLYNLSSNGVDEAFLPFALFAWRGLMYGAIAHSEKRRGNGLAAYVAAPGRVSALRQILCAADMERFEFPREAWRCLADELPMLPKRGYDFSYLRSLPGVDTSPLSQLLEGAEPEEALKFVLDWRDGRLGHGLRSEWKELLGAGDSMIVGSTNIQIAKNITVAGDFKQVIVARPVN
jgi:hypothetical protein